MNGDRRAFCSKLQRHTSSDAGARTGHQHTLTFHRVLENHFFSFAMNTVVAPLPLRSLLQASNCRSV
jgi:hypothetical protein